MKDLFIQSTVDKNGKTFLEVGVEDQISNRVPTDFNVVGTGTVFISITERNFDKLARRWNINFNDIAEALQNQFPRVMFGII